MDIKKITTEQLKERKRELEDILFKPGKEVGLEIIKSEPSTTNAIEALFSSGKFAEMIDKAMKEAFDINIKKKLGRVE